MGLRRTRWGSHITDRSPDTPLALLRDDLRDGLCWALQVVRGKGRPWEPCREDDEPGREGEDIEATLPPRWLTAKSWSEVTPSDDRELMKLPAWFTDNPDEAAPFGVRRDRVRAAS
jgi:hypothetical protein